MPTPIQLTATQNDPGSILAGPNNLIPVMPWEFSPGIVAPCPVGIEQVNVYVRSKNLEFRFAALDEKGEPRSNQYCTAPMPIAVFEQLKVQLMQMILSTVAGLGSEYFTGLGLQDFSKISMVEVADPVAEEAINGSPVE